MNFGTIIPQVEWGYGIWVIIGFAGVSLVLILAVISMISKDRKK